MLVGVPCAMMTGRLSSTTRCALSGAGFRIWKIVPLRMSGSSGCNTLVGTYIAEQGALQFTPAASTMKMCSTPVMDQQQAFFAAMKATTKYQIEGSTLELLNGNQVLAKFQAKGK